jgi:hypothetical protein
VYRSARRPDGRIRNPPGRRPSSRLAADKERQCTCSQRSRNVGARQSDWRIAAHPIRMHYSSRSPRGGESPAGNYGHGTYMTFSSARPIPFKRLSSSWCWTSHRLVVKAPLTSQDNSKARHFSRNTGLCKFVEHRRGDQVVTPFGLSRRRSERARSAPAKKGCLPSLRGVRHRPTPPRNVPQECWILASVSCARPYSVSKATLRKNPG